MALAAGSVRKGFSGDELLAIFLIVAAFALAMICLVVAVSARFADANPAWALAWDERDAEALSAAADRAFEGIGQPEDRPAAARLARRALLAEPIDAVAVRVLAFEAARRADTARAARLMQVARALTLHDPDVQGFLFDRAISRRDYDEASLRADAVFTRDPEYIGALLPIILRALEDRRALAPFAARLAEEPDWRAPFLWTATSKFADLPLARQLYEALASSRSPPTDAETGWLVDRLIAAGDYQGARQEWTRLVRGPSRSPSDMIYNGDFRLLAGAPPFNWRLTSDSGAFAELAQAPGGGSALHVQAPATSDTLLAEQVLVLPAGVWRLSGQALVDQVDTDAGGQRFAWRILCLPETGALPLAQTSQTAGAPGWQSFAVTFAGPPVGCKAEAVRLYGLAHDGFEPTRGWYRAIRVQRVSGRDAPIPPSG